MIREKEENRKAVDALWERFGQIEAGSLITYREIETVIADGYRTQQGRYIIGRFRKRFLEERGVATRCVNGTGVVLLTSSRAAKEIPVERTKKAYRQCNKLLKETDAAAASGDLNDHERRMLAMTRDTVKTARWVAGRAKRAHETAVKATETLPMRKK